jgi:predicted DNA-binding transcriptional regulator AlpA
MTIESAPLLNEKDAAKLLGVSHYLLQRWRWLGAGPKWIKIGGEKGRSVRYRRGDLQQWIERNVQLGGRV